MVEVSANICFFCPSYRSLREAFSDYFLYTQSVGPYSLLLNTNMKHKAVKYMICAARVHFHLTQELFAEFQPCFFLLEYPSVPCNLLHWALTLWPPTCVILSKGMILAHQLPIMGTVYCDLPNTHGCHFEWNNVYIFHACIISAWENETPDF